MTTEIKWPNRKAVITTTSKYYPRSAIAVRQASCTDQDKLLNMMDEKLLIMMKCLHTLNVAGNSVEISHTVSA